MYIWVLNASNLRLFVYLQVLYMGMGSKKGQWLTILLYLDYNMYLLFQFQHYVQHIH